MTPDRDCEFIRLLDGLRIHLRETRDAGNALRYALRVAREHFEADEGCVAVLRPGLTQAEVIHQTLRGGLWDAALLTAFIRAEHPEIPHDHLLAPLRRRGRAWGVMALARRGTTFEKGQGRELVGLATVVSEAVQHGDRERMLEVRDRIDRKIMEQLRPQDLFYQILDGLRSLTRYDHSSAVLMREEEEPALTLAAEQIAWKKGKSGRIGMRLPLSQEVMAIVRQGEVCGFEREAGGWREWDGRPGVPLAALLDFREGGDQPEGSMLVAPLITRDGVIGVLKIAARHPGTFGRYDAELVERFRSQAAIAIQNARRAESLEARVLEAERKHAMADLARGVSHDVNNALGSIIPLVQQMEKDVAAGRLEADVFREDLDHIHQGLQVCRRIFSGMLAFAKGSARQHGAGDVKLALEGALVILRDGLDRRGIHLEIEVPEDIPRVAGGQSDIEQVFLNLITNAREAMKEGGVLKIGAGERDGMVELVIADNGPGIAPEDMMRVLEPFYSTKPQGSGLGLSICRSIVWEMGGKMSLDSKPGQGTTVRVVIPKEGAKTRTGGGGRRSTRLRPGWPRSGAPSPREAR